MLSLIILLAVLLAMAIASISLFWHPRISSDDLVRQFSAERREKDQENERAEGEQDEAEEDQKRKDRRRHLSRETDITRAVIIIILVLIGLQFFVPIQSELHEDKFVSVGDIYRNRILHLTWIAFVAYGLFHYSYWGPREAAKEMTLKAPFRFTSRSTWEEVIGPYLVSLPYMLAVVAGVGGLITAAIVLSVNVDLNDLQELSKKLEQYPTSTANDLQIAAILLVDFGQWIARLSQKYIAASILAFVYLVVEQRSIFHKTILPESIDKIKLGVWVLFFVSLGFSILYLPSQYSRLHVMILNAVEVNGTKFQNLEELGVVMNVQQYLGDHDPQWLILQIISGYGNVLLIVLLGTMVLVKNLFFSDESFLSFAKLLIPSYLANRLESYAIGDESQATDTKSI